MANIDTPGIGDIVQTKRTKWADENGDDRYDCVECTGDKIIEWKYPGLYTLYVENNISSKYFPTINNFDSRVPFKMITDIAQEYDGIDYGDGAGDGDPETIALRYSTLYNLGDLALSDSTVLHYFNGDPAYTLLKVPEEGLTFDETLYPSLYALLETNELTYRIPPEGVPEGFTWRRVADLQGSYTDVDEDGDEVIVQVKGWSDSVPSDFIDKPSISLDKTLVDFTSEDVPGGSTWSFDIEPYNGLEIAVAIASIDRNYTEVDFDSGIIIGAINYNDTGISGAGVTFDGGKYDDLGTSTISTPPTLNKDDVITFKFNEGSAGVYINDTYYGDAPYSEYTESPRIFVMCVNELKQQNAILKISYNDVGDE